jgi:uncharacterized membrane protein YedE/YeeE
MAKKSLADSLTWHFFLPAIGGFLITWIFSMSMGLSLKVGIVVLLCSFLGRYLGKK